jgi:hypothetical protein
LLFQYLLSTTLQEDESIYARRIEQAKLDKDIENENKDAADDVIGDVKYKIDGAEGVVEKVKIDWHDWDQIGSDVKR